MRVLCLGDIQWEMGLGIGIGDSVIENSDATDPSVILEHIKAEISDVDPSIVLFTGDVINDGMNQEEHVDEFLELLTYLEEREIPSGTIPGNHDEYSNYDAVIAEIEQLEYAFELSERVSKHEGISIVGIPYSYTNDLRRTRGISDEFSSHYEILFAHSARARRIWLFEVDADFIVTGHYARDLFQLEGTVFASMDTFPGASVVIEPETQTVEYRQHIENEGTFDVYRTRALANDELELVLNEATQDTLGLRNLQNSAYKQLVLRLRAGKSQVSEADEAKVPEIIEQLQANRVPKKHIQEFIGRYDFL